MNKRGSGAIIAFFLIAILFFAGLWQAWDVINTAFGPPAITQSSPITLVINENETTQQIADDLQAKGLIRNALAFRLWARITGLDTNLQAGVYNLTPGMTVDQIIARLQNGRPDSKNVVVHDGYRLEQIASDAAAAGLPNFDRQAFLNYTHHPNQFPDKAKYPILQGLSSMEGLLYPDTYIVPVTYNTVQVIDMMLNEFDQAVQQYNLVAQAKQHQLTEYQMVILASIVQREASNTGQMPKIAGIYWNLAKNPSQETVGFLSSDPTVEYAYDTDHPPANGHYWVDLNAYGTGKTVEVDSPWNTYTHKGWPPTPISSPNLFALKAAASPEKTNCYFFLTVPKTGALVCEPTYAQIQQDQQKYLNH
ncbi:MAG TPA: endolytic transglycosylase MltG [Ktedonobacteraceae bacterium]|nr:endolytic transglycosylase MltG [Ktedonobacteraceae bacterium]